MYRLYISIILCTVVRFLVKDNLDYLLICLGGSVVLAFIHAYLEVRKIEKK